MRHALVLCFLMILAGCTNTPAIEQLVVRQVPGGGWRVIGVLTKDQMTLQQSGPSGETLTADPNCTEFQIAPDGRVFCK